MFQHWSTTVTLQRSDICGVTSRKRPALLPLLCARSKAVSPAFVLRDGSISWSVNRTINTSRVVLESKEKNVLKYVLQDTHTQFPAGTCINCQLLLLNGTTTGYNYGARMCLRGHFVRLRCPSGFFKLLHKLFSFFTSFQKCSASEWTRFF